jgi:hypothetical protein
LLIRVVAVQVGDQTLDMLGVDPGNRVKPALQIG